MNKYFFNKTISYDLLIELYGLPTIDRGIKLYSNNAVSLIQHRYENKERRQVIDGMVRGSTGKEYRVKVYISSGRCTENNCSCPVAYNCKHGIALLCKFIDDNSNTDFRNPNVPNNNREVDRWLETLPKPYKDLEPDIYKDIEQGDFFAVYVLDVNHKTLVSIAYLCRILKNGDISAPKSFSYSKYGISGFSSSGRKITFSTIDREILESMSLLDSDNGRYYGSTLKAELKGDMGQIILEKVIKTGKTYWRRIENEPLKFGEPIRAKLVWKEKNLQYKASLNTETHVEKVVKCKDLYYINGATGTIGKLLTSSIPLNLFERLVNSPPIPEHMAETVSKKLFVDYPELEIPLPKKIECRKEVVSDIRPVIKIRLDNTIEQTQGNSNNTMSFIGLSGMDLQNNYIKMSFDYKGHLAKPTLTSSKNEKTFSMFKNDILYVITRDTDTEYRAIRKIVSAGFENGQPYIENNPYITFYPKGRSRSEIIEIWGNFYAEIIPALKDDGWVIEIVDGFDFNWMFVELPVAQINKGSDSNWFEFSLGFEFQGENINLLSTIADILSQGSPEYIRSMLNDKEFIWCEPLQDKFAKVPSKFILNIIDTIIELYDTQNLNAEGNLEFSAYSGFYFDSLLSNSSIEWKNSEELKEMNKKIAGFNKIEVVEPPTDLKTKLRDYQLEGLNWLNFLHDFKFNGVLADDMGLGKTVQTLAHLLRMKKETLNSKPNLIVMPTSLVSNWRREAATFAPSLKVLVIHGSKRSESYGKINDYDLVLTTYPLIQRDFKEYEDREFGYIVLDEAHYAKNSNTKTARNLYRLKSDYRLCLTGTPMENHLGELWSIFHFLMPGFLGTTEKFNRLYRKPIEQQADKYRQQVLKKRIQPFMLQRTKDKVALELPPKTEMVQYVELAGKQRSLYETIRISMDKKVRDHVKKMSLAKSNIVILEALLKLRQVCCHPSLLKLEKAAEVKESAKMNLLMELLPELITECRRILLFSQFTSMLAVIEQEIKNYQIDYLKLTGNTQNRGELIDKFNNGNVPVFLISLKAGGIGLNLTGADTVIHYDPWWNPAVETQATDRAYRIGQDKPVFVYKLITEGTVEEKVLKMQEKKKELADNIYKNENEGIATLKKEELLDLFKPVD